jgi:peptidoglycan/LPS O-acetylase OafA/YrhL
MLGAFDFRSNAIGFLRLVLAAAVVVSHAYQLGGFGTDFVSQWSAGRDDLGNLAVGGFFVLSGFLITRSAERSRSALHFVWHRFLRIFPGFWACLIVTAFVIAPVAALAEGRALGSYFASGSDSPFRYIAVNDDLSMRQYGIAGLLGTLPYPRVFDGSLWTLRFEFACYAVIALYAAFKLLPGRRASVAVITAALYVVYAVPIALRGRLPEPLAFDALLHGNNRLVVELVLFFFIGASAYLYRRRIPLNRTIGAVALVAAVVSLRFPWYSLVMPVALSAATLWLAADVPIRDFDRRMDLSYGLYIYAFPLQQVAALAGLPAVGFFVYLLVPLAGALAFATASWFAVERPSLSLKHTAPTKLRPLFAALRGTR